jgi:hypothetical protein
MAAKGLGQMVERVHHVERDQHGMLEREVGGREQAHEQEHGQVHVGHRRRDGQRA